ncbi:hypothetical protein DV737_g3593, partial [Chaetothyriales sp. CBS 132003]
MASTEDQEHFTPPLGPPPLLNQEELLLLARQGFLFLPLSDSLVSSIHKLFQYLESFYQQTLEDKKTMYPAKLGTEFGFYHVENEKEYVTLRCRSGDGGDGTLEDLAAEVWQQSGILLHRILCDIARDSGLATSIWDQILDGTLALPANESGMTHALLRMFKYYPGQGVAEKHTDLGLLTLCVGTQPGLQCLRCDGDQQPYWVDATGPVVLVGQTLRALGNGLLRTGVHQVVPSPEGRLSIVYTLRHSSKHQIDLERFGGEGSVDPAKLWESLKLGFVNINARKDVRAKMRKELADKRQALFYSKGGYALDPSDPEKKLIPRDPEHAGERWIFMNGVSVGKHWLQGNLDLLAATFRRPILGIHNTTHGIPFDVLECIFQRTFSYATLDVRVAYAAITSILTDDSVTKVVLISHSQGAIEASLVLDWLYCTMSAAELQKLEIYTFGNAMNHWNCPAQISGAPTVRHIEHYVNRWDWVSRFGILHFRPLSTMPDPVPNGEFLRVSRKKRASTASLESRLAAPYRFAGRLFLREAPGHMLNQHYFDNLFPMNWIKGEVVTNSHSFMEQTVDESALLADNTVKPLVASRAAVPKHRPGKIRERSRLFQYVNGNIPKEK